MRGFLEQSGSGAAYSCQDAAPAVAGNHLERLLADGEVMIHVPGRTTVPQRVHLPHSRRPFAGAVWFRPAGAADRRPLPAGSALGIERAATLPDAVISSAFRSPQAEVGVAVFQQHLYEAAEEAYATRSLFKGSLAMALLEGLKKHGSKNRIIDGADDTEMTYERVLAVAIAFSKVIKQETDRPRVAIVLPPGKPGLIANLAVLFAGKTPVNLNFTAGHEAIRSTIRQVRRGPFHHRRSVRAQSLHVPLAAESRPDSDRTRTAGAQRQIIKWAVLAKLLPTRVLGCCFWSEPRRNGMTRRVAVHLRLLGRTERGGAEPPQPVGQRHASSAPGWRCPSVRHPRLAAAVPLVRLHRDAVVSHHRGHQSGDLSEPGRTPNAIAELIALHQVNILLATPTFLRGYMKRIDPAQLASLRLVVTGAENCRARWPARSRRNSASGPRKATASPRPRRPPTSISPIRHPNTSRHAPVIAQRLGRARCCPGWPSASPIPPPTRWSRSTSQGIIWFKGANVFGGYLGDPQPTAQVLKEGWFRTGDVGRMDDDGFLYIEGRISRFSKIAGEMVPHETRGSRHQQGARPRRRNRTPDRHHRHARRTEGRGHRPALHHPRVGARTGVHRPPLPPARRGPALAVVPASQILSVPEIPVLASGKLDIKGCEESLAPARLKTQR